jgi:hypothetical protein
VRHELCKTRGAPPCVECPCVQCPWAPVPLRPVHLCPVTLPLYAAASTAPELSASASNAPGPHCRGVQCPCVECPCVQGHDKSRLGKTRQDKTRQVKARSDKTRQVKARQDKTRQDKPRQDKTRQDNVSPNSSLAKTIRMKNTVFSPNSSDRHRPVYRHLPTDITEPKKRLSQKITPSRGGGRVPEPSMQNPSIKPKTDVLT